MPVYTGVRCEAVSCVDGAADVGHLCREVHDAV